MKYLFIILFIVTATTVATLFVVWPEKQNNPDNVVVVVNGHALTREAIQYYKDKTQHHGAQEDFINEAITKQLLIAEAQRLKIDTEENFRHELKAFYEHSLIKILMERVHKELIVEVTDQEIDDYLNSFGKIYTFYTMKTSAPVSFDKIKEQGTKHIEPFEELSKPLQQTLAGLRQGQSTMGFVTGNEKFAVYLEVVTGQTKEIPQLDRDIIRQLLLQSKEETQTNNWIENLRRQAAITFN